MQSRPIRPWQGRPAAAAGFEPAAALGGKGANAALLQNSQQAFPFALRALQDFRRGNHQHLKPPLLHITEQFLYIRAKQQRRSLRRVADALLLDQPAQLVGRAAAGVALPKHCGGVLGVILVKALYRQSDRTILAKQLGISEHQLSYITHSNSGEGLLFYGNVTIPFVDRFPRGEIYDLLTTRPEDMKNETKNE